MSGSHRSLESRTRAVPVKLHWLRCGSKDSRWIVACSKVNGAYFRHVNSDPPALRTLMLEVTTERTSVLEWSLFDSVRCQPAQYVEMSHGVVRHSSFALSLAAIVTLVHL